MPTYNEFSPGYFRGPRPQCAEDLTFFHAVLNLQSDIPELFQVAEERTWAESRKIAFQHIPMSLVTPPTPHQVKTVLEAILQSPAPLLVHCHDGVDRTGVVVAAFRRRQQVSFGAAIGEMLDQGFHLDRYFWWLPSLENLLK